MKLLILTGMSGAGKSTAFKMLEDLGYYCVDNLPIPLLKSFIDLSEQPSAKEQKLVVGIDIRSGESLHLLQSVLSELRQDGKKYSILFLDAEDEVLVKRYKETRRNHPLSGTERIQAGIIKERAAIGFLKEEADYIIDTSHLLTRELKEELQKIFEIQKFVMGYEESHIFLDKLVDMIEFLIPNYIKEGKNQLVIAIGCTGGKHRSVTLANKLHERLLDEDAIGVKIEHRDIGKDALRGK